MKREGWIGQVCKIVQRITWMVGALTIIFPIVCWGSIPDVIPSHYNAAGKADQYAGKEILIFLLLVIVFLMGIMSIAVYYVKQETVSKYAEKAEKSQMSAVYVMLIFMNFAMQCMFAYIIFCSAAGRELGGWFLPVVLVAVFCPLLFFGFRCKAGGEKRTERTALVLEEKQEEGIIYRSKVDWWLGLLLGTSVIFVLYTALLPIIHGEGIKVFPIVTAVLVLVIVLSLFGIKYVFIPVIYWYPVEYMEKRE